MCGVFPMLSSFSTKSSFNKTLPGLFVFNDWFPFRSLEKLLGWLSAREKCSSTTVEISPLK